MSEVNGKLNEKLMAFAVAIELLELELKGINDYGEITGFCQEQAQIWNDAAAALGSLTARAYTLKRRAVKFKEGDRNV